MSSTKNINNFTDFLVKNDIVITIIATIISNTFSNLTQSLLNNILYPLINIDLNGDGISDRKNLDNFSIKIFGSELKVGKFFITLIEFSIVLFTIYVLNINLQKFI